ncbi:chemotaxis protein CheX [Geomonas limicola]|uniref:Chemotaxis protein CheX n=1 Tax=Geomonas limicola TaxID=2740186 RepID=A0A6V8N709_9BACT|nr:chemotaxis protein CheX [Geomonas limicola]GFO67333.1 chemotaxis protein CheX [Geomonas limicola]
MLGEKILKQLNTTEEDLIGHLNNDVLEIFSTMVGGGVLSSKKAETETHFNDSVSAMVGFAGGYNGMIAINASRKQALRFAAQMLGMEVDECEEEMADALGEIANMIGGSFKHHFVKDGHEVKLSTPSVISGGEYEMTVCSLPDTLTLQFETEEESFTVSLYLETD